MDIMKTAKEVNPLFWIGIVLVVVSYMFFARSGNVPDDVKIFHMVAVVVLLLFAFSTKERRLLTIKEGQDIAFKDAKIKQNMGELKEDGRLILLEDGVLKRMNREPDSIVVGVGIECSEPKVLVYSIHPYTGYVLRISKRDYWDARKDPDLKLIIPPSWIDFLKVKKELMTDVDII